MQKVAGRVNGGPPWVQRLMAIDIKGEVFVLHLLVRAVGADFGDGRVELIGQGLIALAYRNTGPAAEVFRIFISRARYFIGSL